MAKRVLLLTQWFDPEPTFKGIVFARELQMRGFQVEVVTGFPNYPQGKLYPGYKIKALQKEHIDGIEVNRVALYPSHDSSALKRVFNYLSFSFSALVYCLFKAKKADVIYAYHPPLTVGFTAIITKLFRRIPVVYDIQDMWPDTLRSTGMLTNEWVLRLIGLSAKLVYKFISRIVVLSPGFKKLLIQRGVPSGKIDVIPNWCDEESLNMSNVDISNLFPSGSKFTVLFAGNLGYAQALNTIIDAASLLDKKLEDVTFVFLGDGVVTDSLKNEVKHKNLSNVIFLPQVPMSDVGTYLKKADVLLVHLRRDPLFEITIPSKTQAYMSVGKPIIMGVPGDAAEIIKKAQCGLIIEPESPEQLADSVEKLYRLGANERSQLGKNAADYYDKHLSVKVGVDHFAEIFSELKSSNAKK